MPQQFSIEEMQTQIRDLQLALATPGIPDDEAQMHRTLIARIQAEIRARTAKAAPVTPPPPPTPPQPIKHTAPPPPPPSPKPTPLKGGKGGEQTPPNQQPTTNNQQPIRVIAPTAIPKDRTLHATVIHADHQTNPHNPRLTITWTDGYTFTGDETAIRGRFTSTLRDTIALKYAQEKRFEKIWRWDTPWRCAGFYRALIHLNPHTPPTLADLGFTRPSDITRTIFQLITDAAALHENHITR